MSNFKLSPHELKQFHQKGYIGPFTLYTPEEMKEIFKDLRLKLLNTKTAIYNEQREKIPPNKPSLLGYDRHLDVPFLAELIAKKEIVQKINDILGEDILCWRTELFPKYPGDEGTDWHQAKTFGGVTGAKKPQLEWPEDSNLIGSITIWTAFTPAHIDNGCLQFIPGTHTTMYYDERKKMDYDPDKINSIKKDGIKRGLYGFDFRDLRVNSDWKPNESRAKSMIMQPGQFIIFWETLMHASHEHKGLTNEMRVGFSARYVPTFVKVYPDTTSLNEFGYTASLSKHKNILVSGVDKFGHNKVITNGALLHKLLPWGVSS